MIPEDVIEIQGGFWVPKNSTHIPEWQIMSGRLDHDEFLTPYCCKLIPEGGCVVDGGAFNGDHTIAYSRKAGPEGLIFAFEPGELAFKCLDHNCLLFEDQNVIPIRMALGASSGKTMHDPTYNADLGMSRCGTTGTESISVITLDEVIHPHGMPVQRKVDFMKLDLEGWEVEALRGAAQILSKDRPKMVIEVNVEALKNQGTSYQELAALLSDYKYTHQRVQPENDPNLWDILCTPID